MEIRSCVRMCSLLGLLLLLPGCWKSEKAEESKVKVVNVLDKNFYDDAHIPGSINIPVTEVMNTAKNWPKDTKIVVYCSNYMCSASGTIARKLKNDLKFENVYAYEAGMAGWKQAGLPVEGPAQEAYLDAPNQRFSERKHSDIIEISTENLKELLDDQVLSKV